MKVVTVSAEEKFFYDLLTKVREEGLILQTTDGEQFVLLSLEGWKSFDIGSSNNFEQEVEATVRNQKLMAFLAARRSGGKRIPMADVKKQLGLN